MFAGIRAQFERPNTLNEPYVSEHSDKSYSDSAPIFVVGMPRSGTTLIDNILETQEQSYVLSEQPFIYLLKEYMRSEFNKQYPKDVNRLTDKECSELRAMYFQLINQIDAPTDKQNIIVDKSPHYIGYIPFILKVFPSAKFLISIRHPLDVCLSCHRVNFNVNSDTQYLVSMKAIVERYKEVFTFFEHLSEQVVFDYRVVKYEELVTNFDEAILEALQYIGVEKPNAEYVNFHETAKQKFVSSASSNQTNQPLYSSSLFSWKNYADEIEEYIPALSTMIEKWENKREEN